MTRTGTSSWVIRIGNDAREPDYFDGGTVSISTNQPLRPWDEIDIDIDLRALIWAFDAELHLAPPVRCPNPDGVFTIDCE